jgi:type III secretion protein V
MKDKVGMIGEAAFPFILFLVLGSMLLPIPPLLLDFLIVGNLVLALLLFLSCLYTSDSLKLSSMPSILLLATLYRLALNVSTTRSILSRGDAGDLIEVFGDSVTGGNVAVGLIIFLIITLVQFVVIAKGAERVAEVSARFTLDALPGKQMSIDADIRAGLIDFADARNKRDDLQIESRFYGALDGAMKFVKGDAIAGLVITCINIIGGVAIGIVALNYGVTESLYRFTRLTVGDGLVSQVPALLNSLSAGIIVTRVVRGENHSLISEMGRQVFAQSHVLAIIAAVSVILGIFSPFPLIPFVVVGAVFFALSLLGIGSESQTPKRLNKFEPKLPSIFSLSMNRNLAQEIEQELGLEKWVDGIRSSFHEKHGLILPVPEMEYKDEESFSFELYSRGRSLGKVISAKPDSVAEELVDLLGNSRGSLLDDRMTRKILDFYEKQAPEIVTTLVPEQIAVTALTKVLRAILDCGLSLRNIDAILQACSEALPGAEHDELVAAIRIALKHELCAQYTHEGKLNSYVLSPDLDLFLWKASRGEESLDREMIALLSESLSKANEVELIVCSSGARRFLERFLSNQGVFRPVLGFEEIANESSFEVVGTIDFLSRVDSSLPAIPEAA